MRKLIGYLAVVLSLAFLVGAGYGLHWFNLHVWSELPSDLSSLRDFRPLSSCLVYAADGSRIDQFYIERRIWVPIDEIPPIVWQAFVAIEDRRFLDHKGIDPVGIMRAAVRNMQSGNVMEGASTITQQIVKNLLVGNDRTYRRKLKEAVLALRLERELDKMTLLEIYLNLVYLGDGNYGVGAAAEDYFGRPARELDPGQAATLAGLVAAPSRRSPRKHPRRAAAHRLQVLASMVTGGYLSAAAAAGYEGDPVYAPLQAAEPRTRAAAYQTVVRREIRTLLGRQAPFRLGLRVHTALDLDIQETAEDALRKALQAIDERQGRRGRVAVLSQSEVEAFLRRAPGLPAPAGHDAPPEPQAGSCFPAVLGRAGLDELRAASWSYRMRDDQREVLVYAGERGEAPLREMVREGDILQVCLDQNGEAGLDTTPRAEGAVVVIENQTGYVRAIVGGYRDRLEGFVRATQARRQPGSSFKPYVYATALVAGRRQTSRVLDGPLSLPAGNGKVWSPGNFGDRYLGWVRMREALAASLNSVAVRLAVEVGVPAVVQTARAMGVRSPLESNAALALGASEVTPMDQALGYATIARQGVPTDPIFILSLQDDRGGVVAQAGQRLPSDLGGARLPGGPLPRALPAGVAYELADMLRNVVESGTGRRAFDPDGDRAGKTGTTNGFADAWFVGFTSRYTIAVWIGTDDREPLGHGETGSRAALPAWLRIVESLPHPQGARFAVPDEAVIVRVGERWLGFPRGRAPRDSLPRATASDAPLPPFLRRSALRH